MASGKMDSYGVHLGTGIAVPDSDYTTLSDGYYVLIANSGGYCYGYIDGQNIAQVSRLNGAVDGKLVVYIKKGMNIKAVGRDFSATFYPIE